MLKIQCMRMLIRFIKLKYGKFIGNKILHCQVPKKAKQFWTSGLTVR